MSDRFVVVPVGQGNEQCSESKGAEGYSIEPQDAVPVLEYSREPNRYGKMLPVSYSSRYYPLGISYVFHYGLFMLI